MRYLIVLIISIFCLQHSYAQNHEIGVFLGGSNFIGDAGSTVFINPSKLAVGGVYKWNRTPRVTWRATGMISNLVFDDTKSDDPSREQRGYKVTKNRIAEASAGLEFNFFEFDLNKSDRVHTPYLFLGVSAGLTRDFHYESSRLVSDDSESWILGIPMAFGYKFRISHSLILGAEVAARYTFSDNIDGSDYTVKVDGEITEDHRYGNINNNDWYVFTGITLTYTFGRNPCYCIN
ncbi:DUF6089 family protein [Formosa haliotis]|uniref:type IX secretion system protein PorG n=1 Tax=Formosa haliotis TaxID=1555194 RepID=UPI0008260D64|nr:DUF6089 family protein [Formosa haliotis]